MRCWPSSPPWPSVSPIPPGISPAVNGRCWLWRWSCSTRPELLLIDELSLGLAPIVVQELLGALAQLREQGRTMLVVEQSVSVALNLADRAMFLENGRVVFEGRSEELLQRDDLLHAAFLGGPAAATEPTGTGTVES